MELWEEHIPREHWEEIKNDPDFDMEAFLEFYKTAGNQELPVIKAVIALIESHLANKPS